MALDAQGRPIPARPDPYGSPGEYPALMAQLRVMNEKIDIALKGVADLGQRVSALEQKFDAVTFPVIDEMRKQFDAMMLQRLTAGQAELEAIKREHTVVAPQPKGP